MANNRCFLCGYKMLESGLCSNAKCVRSQPLSESKNRKKEVPDAAAETGETQAESGSDA